MSWPKEKAAETTVAGRHDSCTATGPELLEDSEQVALEGARQQRSEGSAKVWQIFDSRE